MTPPFPKGSRIYLTHDIDVAKKGATGIVLDADSWSAHRTMEVRFDGGTFDRVAGDGEYASDWFVDWAAASTTQPAETYTEAEVLELMFLSLCDGACSGRPIEEILAQFKEERK